MRQIHYAFYGEGTTNNRLLPAIIHRSIVEMIIQYGNQLVEILEPYIIDQLPKSQEDPMIQAAKLAFGYDFLIVHFDANHEMQHRVRIHRFDPNIEKIAQIQTEHCEKIVPLIPVYSSESWMLVDSRCLIDNLSTELSAEELNLPSFFQVETVSNPRQLLITILDRVNKYRRNKIDISELYLPLGNQSNLYRPNSYSIFSHYLEKALKELGLIDKLY
ncbi:hypothetical protein [Herpetosiphon llansteffanensis]|uniref:hypothetical protein n=1 Tax=Herpetosiphon llansteffanensis TaxID=2094568 RepID=UPI000D7C0FEB|nr:hypothetical protein [Herpetosiphon llansteffanensis]